MNGVFLFQGLTGLQGVGSLVNTITLQPGDPDCADGGVMIEVGIDYNDNGILESNEVDSTEYVCNGVGMDSLVSTVTLQPGHPDCYEGGVMIDVGTDDNGNGMLDPNEIDSTEYICNGVGMDREDMKNNLGTTSEGKEKCHGVCHDTCVRMA